MTQRNHEDTDKSTEPTRPQANGEHRKKADQ